MSLWVAVLARLDLHIQELGRIPLYASGLILTFNLGRDITLITLYTFIFGSAIVCWLHYSSNHPAQRTRRAGSGGRAKRNLELCLVVKGPYGNLVLSATGCASAGFMHWQSQWHTLHNGHVNMRHYN